MVFNHIFCFECGEHEIEVEVEVNLLVSNDGIGAYEYWGQRCFDKGQPTFELESFKVISAYWTGLDRVVNNLHLKTRFYEIVEERLFGNEKDALADEASQRMADDFNARGER